MTGGIVVNYYDLSRSAVHRYYAGIYIYVHVFDKHGLPY